MAHGWIAYDTTPNGSGDLLVFDPTRDGCERACIRADCDMAHVAFATATARLAAALDAGEIVARWTWTDGDADLCD